MQLSVLTTARAVLVCTQYCTYYLTLPYVHYLRAEIAYRFTISKQIYFLAPCFVSIVNSFCIAFVERNEVCTMKKIDSVYV